MYVTPENREQVNTLTPLISSLEEWRWRLKFKWKYWKSDI